MFNSAALRHAFIACLLSLLPALADSNDTPVIAAASSLKFALQEIFTQFHSDTHQNVKLTFGSSGNFYRQIIQGAPFELFFSADETYVLKLVQAEHTLDKGQLYAHGRLVLFAPQSSSLHVDAQAHDLKAALADGRLRRFAIAHPEHAPYGRAAREALQSLRLWTSLQTRLVLGENVSQAAQFAASGSTQGGIISYSLALAPTLQQRGTFVLLSEQLHQPLKQRMVLLKHAGPTARQFYAYIQQAPAQAILKRYGFTVPN